MEIKPFYEKAAGFAPNPLQQAVWDRYFSADAHPALLVRAGTGAGKTEAVLFPALADRSPRRRVILILPSKALIEDMGERVRCIGARLSDQGIADLDITLDMGGSCRRFRCRNGTVETHTYYRHLFADDIILTTLDKFLFRAFGYGEAIKSFIFPHRIFGSALGKSPFIIFDEAHEYDGLAFTNFLGLLQALYAKGKDLCVMSATLPARFVDFLDTVDATSGELGQRQDTYTQERMVCREKNMSLCAAAYGEKDGASADKKAPAAGSDQSRATLVTSIAEAVKKRYAPDRRIIARTEYVRDLVKLHAELKVLAPLVYHGRMTSDQRRWVVKELIRRQERDEGFLVLATSAIEAGCDLDAHFIVTQLCNPDSLVQLAGRLNRRGRMTDAELVVVGDRMDGRLTALDKEQMDAYLHDLEAMQGHFEPERLANYFQAPAGDWMGEILFDMLYGYVYEGDLSAKPLWDRGILVTRSWEPAVTLCTGVDNYGRPQNAIQVGLSRMATAISGFKKDSSGLKYKDWIKKQVVRDRFSIEKDHRWHADLFKAFFNPGNPEQSRWKLTPFKGNFVSGYETDLICVIRPEFADTYFDPQLGYVRLPRIFFRGYKDGFRQFLDYRPEFKEDGCFKLPGEQSSPKHQGRVWYLER